MKTNILNSRWTGFALFLALFGTLTFLSLNKWKNDPLRVIWSDAEGYYLYLPGTFLYQFEDMPLRTPGWPKRGNKIFTKYSCGVAIMQAPFFAVAHIYSSLTRFDADGFSYPYGIAIILSAIFYMLLGIWLLHRILRKHFARPVLIVTYLLLGLGSNLYYYTIAESGMSHIYSFFLFAAIIYLTDKVINRPDRSSFMILGLVFGLTILVRPTNIIAGLWILFYNVSNLQDFLDRIDFFRRHLLKLTLAFAAFLATWVPQLIYWRYVAGEWVAYSYGEEGFDHWKNPKMIQVLTDLENGLFLYSPAVLIALLGVFYCIESKRSNGWLTLILFTIATYMFGSWWDWNFGGAFGHRCYVEYYALLFGPMAWTIDAISKSRYKISKVTFAGLSFLLIYYSLQMSYAYAPPWDGPNWNWSRFWAIVQTFF
ncbi:MAG: glycosyltransferase family 39 protein [Saprospiraceae bacterium]|nr:glycosyltransferase family 39 protein [Saprospiraceae bacterium]